MRIVYLGTPEFAREPLKALHESRHEVVLCVTQPDRVNSRRGKKVIFSPVKQFAIDNGIEVFQPERVSSEESFEYIKSFSPDVIVVCAYGQILRSNILHMARFGAVNIHASLLPHLRGAAPMNRAIMNGDRVTGVTTMMMDEGLDTGDMLLKSEIEITDEMNIGDLHDLTAMKGSELIVRTLDALEKGEVTPVKQDDSKSTYAQKISKEEMHIDFSDTAVNIHNKIRGLSPFPLAYCYLDEKNIKIYESFIKKGRTDEICGKILSYDKKEKAIMVAASDGIIGIRKLKMQGKRMMDSASFYNGNRDIEGKVLK